MASEAEIQAEVALAVGGRDDARLFRNTVGTGWSGELVEQRGGMVRLRNARFVRYGLFPGSADLVGWHSMLVGPEHMGRRFARMLSLEVKAARGRVRPDQATWLRMVDGAGGLAAIVRSPDEAIALLTTTITEGVTP